MGRAKYELQISFAAVGDAAVKKLDELYRRLQPYRGHRLVDVYIEFGLVSLGKGSNDILVSMDGYVQKQKAEERVGSFTLVTKTEGTKQCSLWRDISRFVYPELTSAVVGTDSNGESVCETIHQARLS